MSEAYKASGVNLEAGYEVVKRIEKHIAGTARVGAMNAFGAFGGLFDLSALDYKEPMLVSGTDGVGTKLKIAFAMNKHNTIGIDVVAMCVNDIITQGAEPLFFLDYLACGKNDPNQIEAIVSGVAQGCKQSKMALIGGETAEMPSMYLDGEYDIAGFAVGVVEKSKCIDKANIRLHDVIIGLPSSGIHSNGYSLVRKIIADNQLDLNTVYDGLPDSLGNVVLEPTKIYVESVQNLKEKVNIHGMAHITGGGFYENVPRMLPAGVGASFNKKSWTIPEIFHFLGRQGKLSETELFNIFNMGIGFMFVIAPEDVEKALTVLGEEAKIIGEVVADEGVHFQYE